MTDTPPTDAELKFAIDLARLADQTRCHNVVLLDLRQKSPVTKFFLLATGTSDRQRRTVGDELIAHGKLNGFPAWRSNGYETAKWIVVDFIDVVAHIFEEASRNFYDLEMLWGDCPRVTWQLPQPETAAASPASSAAAAPPLDMTQELESIMAAQALTDADRGLDSDGQGDNADAPQVEEFIDDELFVAQVGDDGGVVETTAVEIIAISTPVSRAASSKKKREAMAAKPAAKIAGRTAKAAKAKPKASARAKVTTSAARRAKAPAAKVKTATSGAAKAKKSSKAPTAKPALTRVKAARPGSKKAPTKKTIAKKIAGHKPAAKKLAKPAAGKSRGVAPKQIKKPAVKTKKR